MGGIFRQSWFWLLLGGSVFLIAVILNRFSAKKGVPPHQRMSPISKKNEKLISRVTDVFMICILVLVFALVIFISFTHLYDNNLYDKHQPEIIRAALADLSTILILCSGISAVLVGLLSPFQQNLRKSKRIFLLIICILPALFTLFALLVEPSGFSRRIIKLCLFSLLPWLFFNGPAIILGKSYIEFIAPLTNRLNRFIWLMDTENPEDETDN